MYNPNEITLNFQDALKLKDKFCHPTLRGHVTFRDEFGNIILEKDNLIVLRGRTFTLEKLFNDPISNQTSGYVSNLNRTISLFKIGSGGADIQSAPFQPYNPEYSDIDLAHPVPFVTLDPNKQADPDKAENPSIIESMTDSDKSHYFLPISKSNNIVEYYGKVFESNPQWVFNKETNEVYKKINLKIASNEARGYIINELGLVLAEYDGTNGLYKDAELFSRVTFDSQSMTSLTKYILVEYLIFA